MDEQLSQQFKEIGEQIKKASAVLIVTHEKPDGDCIGSSLALASIIEKSGKDCFCFCPDSLPDYLNFLPASYKFKNSLPDEPFDLVIALDYGRYQRLGKFSSIQDFDENKLITIDHHPYQDQKGGIKIIAPYFASTAEIIYRFFKDSNFEISKDVAICLFAGIFTDTGRFRNAATNPETLRAAGDLVGKGVNLAKIAKLIFQPKSLRSVKVRGLILSRVEYDKNSGIAYSWISQKDFKNFSVDYNDIDDLAGTINSISTCRFAMFMCEDAPGDIYCSLRSEPFKNINVAKIAERLGGGGHPYAAGFRFKGSLKGALESVKKTVRILG